MRRRRTLGLSVLCVSLSALAFAAAPALALTTHVFSTSFGSAGSGDGQLSSPQGVAVNSTSHDVYVADTGNARIEQFSSSGAFIRTFGTFTAPAFIAVDNGALSPSNGDVYVGDTGTNLVQKFGPSGNLIALWGSGGQLDGSSATAPIAGPFGSLAGVAVDGLGNLWVYDQNANMFEFAQDSSFTTDWNSGRGVNPAGIGADSAGNPYVLTGGGSVEQFSPTGTDVGPVNGDVSSPTGFGIDPSSNDVYMDNGGTDVYHYPSSCDAGGACTATEIFGSPNLSAAAALAVDPSDQTVYAADTGNSRVAVFAPVALPDATTNPASNVQLTSATLNASVDPAGNGDIIDCHFQIIDDAAFSNNGGNYSSGATDVPCDQPTPISSPTAVTATASLHSGTRYHFRILATNAAGTNAGSDQTFSTISHLFTTTFAGSGTNALSGPTAVAVDNSSGPSAHDVYVNDPGHFRIEKFDSAGNFILMFGKGVDQTTGADVCTAASGDTCRPGTQAAASGAPIGAFGVPTYLAVDNTSGPSAGDVYVADIATNLIQKFAPDGTLITSWGDSHANAPAPNGQFDASSDNGPGPPLVRLDGIAVDPAGNLWFRAETSEVGGDIWRVFEFDQSGRFHASFPGNSIFSLIRGGAAVDSVGNLYVPQGLEPPPKGVLLITPGASGDELTANTVTGSGVTPIGFAIDPNSDDLYVDNGGTRIDRVPSSCRNNCSPADTFGSPQLNAAQGLSVDGTSGDVYVADTGAGDVAVFDGVLPFTTTGPASSGHTTATLNGHLDPAGRGNVTDCHFEYVTDAAFRADVSNGKFGYSDLSSGGTAPCAEGQSFSSASDVHVDLTGLAVETTYHYRLVASNAAGASVGLDRTFTPHAVFGLSTDPATDINTSSATLNGSYTGEGIDTTYRFAYGKTSSYGHLTASLDAGSASGPQSLSAAISNLVPGTTYHYAFLATNSFGTTVGPDRSFNTPQPPTIDAFSSANVTADSADLHAQINPQGYDTTYHFEYGTTTGYGQSAPLSEADAGSASADQSVVVHIGGLQGTIYHFRLLATSKWGTTTSADQTFEFFPPGCPNAAVRQQTGAAYLPDCRAYELVSPGEANGTILFPGGPNSGTATNPSRLSFTGAYSSLPGATQTVGSSGDLYVATRTDSGWVSKYVGLPGNQTGCVSGPPNNPWSHSQNADKIANFILTDPAMDRFLDWDDGSSGTCKANGNGTGDANTFLDPPSNAPYLWSADGSPIAHLPTSFASTPGAAAAFTCPNVGSDGSPSLQAPIPRCISDVSASGDLTHLAFSSNSLAFTPGALTTPPGSAYDNDLASGAVSLISALPGGGDIPQDPAYAASLADYNATHYTPNVGEFIRFPAVSTDGSHILMSTATAVTPECDASVCPRFTDIPLHLYMRVNDAISYDVSQGHAVNYVGMTPNGSKVYFTSDQQLTPDDTDNSTDLYMWSEATDSLTRLSAAGNGAPEGAGNSDSCAASWTAGCGVAPYSGWSFASTSDGGYGGNGVSDSAIAPLNGDIYFYSPEQLDGDHGVAGQQNLYVYRGGRSHFVATLDPGPFCLHQGLDPLACSDGPLVRLEVNPDDTRAAFVTAVRLTSYDNAGHLEMYSYDPATGAIVCASCRPDGDPPTSDVVASQDGRFLTNDGRVFFATEESLVPQDTNQGLDVYEFVDGRPQLITPGTGIATIGGRSILTITERPGLDGVSADGTDVYFSTYDSLLPEDHNGNFMKFYDARTNGGFPEPPPAPPCAAAEECHGPGSSAPNLPTQGTAATLAGGNATPRPHPRRHKKKHHKRHHARHANANRGGGK